MHLTFNISNILYFNNLPALSNLLLVLLFHNNFCIFYIVLSSLKILNRMTPLSFHDFKLCSQFQANGISFARNFVLQFIRLSCCKLSNNISFPDKWRRNSNIQQYFVRIDRSNFKNSDLANSVSTLKLHLPNHEFLESSYL